MVVLAMSKELTEEKFKKVLTELHQLNTEKLFEEIVSDNWRLFGFKEEPSLIQFEAFLMSVILHFSTKDCTTPHEEKRIIKKKEELLLMFGLLDGYYHTDIDFMGIKFPIPEEERRKKYVEDGNFIEVKSTQDKVNSLYRKFRRELNCNDGYFLLYFFRKIKNGSIQKIIRECTKTPPQIIILPNGESRIELPKPCMVHKKSLDAVTSNEQKDPPLSSQDHKINEKQSEEFINDINEAEKDIQGTNNVHKEAERQETINTYGNKDGAMDALDGYDSGGQPDTSIPPPPSPVPEPFQEQRYIFPINYVAHIVAVSALAIIAIVVVFSLIDEHKAEKEQSFLRAIEETSKITSYKIKFKSDNSNEGITLDPGEEKLLEVETEPRIEVDKLSYSSTEDDIVKVKYPNIPYVIATRNIEENRSLQAYIIASIGGNNPAYGAVIVTVRNSNFKSSLSEGKNNDESSGDMKVYQ